MSMQRHFPLNTVGLTPRKMWKGLCCQQTQKTVHILILLSVILPQDKKRNRRNRVSNNKHNVVDQKSCCRTEGSYPVTGHWFAQDEKHLSLKCFREKHRKGKNRKTEGEQQDSLPHFSSLVRLSYFSTENSRKCHKVLGFLEVKMHKYIT